MPLPPEQLRELMIGLLPRLRRLAQAIVEPVQAADDLVQQCIERALPVCGSWHSDRELESGLFSLLMQACTGHQHAEPFLSVPAEGGDAGSLRRLYAALPLQQRMAIALVVIEQRSYRDAAAMLGLPLETLTQQLWCGRERLLDAETE